MEQRDGKAFMACAFASAALLTLVMGADLAAAGDGRVVKADALRLRIVLHTPLGAPDLAVARTTADGLLTKAGIHTAWTTCSVLLESCGSSNIPGTLTVRILPTNVTPRHAGGHLVRDFEHGSTALIHEPWHATLIQHIRNSSAGRSDPSLATLTVGHTMGLAIAHEVGHALGLHHTSRGVMKPLMDREDLRALRGNRLFFEGNQSDQMRQALLGMAAQNAELR
jgi:hypothetical protein